MIDKPWNDCWRSTASARKRSDHSHPCNLKSPLLTLRMKNKPHEPKEHVANTRFSRKNIGFEALSACFRQITKSGHVTTCCCIFYFDAKVGFWSRRSWTGRQISNFLKSWFSSAENSQIDPKPRSPPQKHSLPARCVWKNETGFNSSSSST